ncbi:PHP domain-containing protein [Paraliomyxa miuraensis]|uniref:PHP domain-containing protein n=1 Tax=Paraliomyxa miuraensis TaxID=376150 RepID=UPI002254EBB8|nr:hypothetical protein [Paraliomyxa miuraensis]MCX4246889.1 hypothetical protein [Paraliomyxa miuraensis]
MACRAWQGLGGIGVAVALGGCSVPVPLVDEATGTSGSSTVDDGGTTTSSVGSGPDSTTTGLETTGLDTTESGTTGTDDGAPLPCDPTTTGAEIPPPEDHGFATEPPRMALADAFYGYEARTRIGDCSTDRVRWTFVAGPPGSSLEVGGARALSPGESLQWEDGGSARERAKLVWDLAGVGSGCHSLELSWQAWLDCGLGDDGAWGPVISQAWELAVRDNHWWSGDLHVHTRHSERGDEAGGVQAYYERMINVRSDDAGHDFSDRRLDSLRGRLHWLVFSDHTNNELEECGRHFSSWCAAAEGPEVATGRDVVRAITEADPSALLVVGSEISNQFDGHFGFLPRNPVPGHPVYAPGYMADPTDYDHDAGFGPGIFRERWVDPTATNAEELALAHAMGGLAIVNHESAIAPWVEYDWSSLDFDGLEVWNGGNRHDQDDDSAYHGGLDLNAVVAGDLLTTELPEQPLERSWVGMLKHGRWPMMLVGGSDVHDHTEVVCGSFPCDPTNAELASPTTTVWAPSFVWTNGADGVLDGLAAARVVVHDRSTFIDLRVTIDGQEYLLGDTIDYVPGQTLMLRAFGRVSDYIDGDNRVLLVLGTSGDAADPVVDVLYSSEDATHFVQPLVGSDEMQRIRPDSNFDRSIMVSLDASRLGASGTYLVWAQLMPWHNPLYAFGNGRDHALTGAIRLRAQ